ncbi:hypothetical protein GEV33_002025 [Tenebrio molitor]|uniref:Uncharacterized protein n=2 Tax=Endopterygota TaxID=33392 RepID=A0A8J6HVT8_TENMO|nr:hypothetical protein GEV33_002025 [Tenebrio molitor]
MNRSGISHDTHRAGTKRQRKQSSSSSSSTSSTSTSSSSSGDAKRQLKKLKRRLATIERASNFSGPGLNDEALIAIFDPQKDHLTIEAWVSRVDDVAKKYNWSSKNPTPSSPRYCRPIRIRFVKESNDITNDEILYMKSAISSLRNSAVTLPNKIFSVKHTLKFTMVEGKVCNAATQTSSTMRCYICGKTSKDFNSLTIEKEVKQEALQFGLSILHARIRLFESILHLGYKLPVQKWQLRSQDEKAIVQETKLKMQQDFKNKMGLIVDVPKPGFGNTNDGNTSRRFFADPDLAAEITGVDINLIFRFKVILEVISSGHEVDTEKFSAYATETAELYIRLYPWHPMTPTMHKILVHGALVIQNALLPIGQLSEEAAEALVRLESVPNIIIETVGSELESNNSPADTLYTATICEDMRTIKQEIEEIKTNFNALKEEIKENYSKINVSLDKIFRILSSQEPMHKEQAVAPPKEDLLANIQFTLGSCEELIETETIIRNNVEFRTQLIKSLTKVGGCSGEEVGCKYGHSTLGLEVIYLADNRYTRQKNIAFLKDAVLKHAKKRMCRKRKASPSASTSSANIVAPDDVAVNEQIDDQNNVESDGENISPVYHVVRYPSSYVTSFKELKRNPHFSSPGALPLAWGPAIHSVSCASLRYNVTSFALCVSLNWNTDWTVMFPGVEDLGFSHTVPGS